MNLKDVIKLLKKNIRLLGVYTLTGAVIGLVTSFIPGKYTATGSFFIGRLADKPSSAFFTYEGYYATQTAQSYTNTAAAILESEDLKKETLLDLQIPVTDNNIKKLNRSYRVTKRGPQIIQLTVSDYDQNVTERLYRQLSSNFLTMGRDLGTKNDENISVITIAKEPLLSRNQRSYPAYMLGGMLLGLSLSLFKISFREYMK